MATQVYNATGGGLIGLFPNPIISDRDPSTTDRVSPTGQPYQIFQGWNNRLTDATFIYLGQGVWVTITALAGSVTQLTGNSGVALPVGGNINIVGTGTLNFVGAGSTITGTITPGTGLVATLTGDSGGARPPTAGNINLLGTANQITVTGAASTLTWSIPATFIAPGSIASTTTITAGTALVATTTVTAGTGITSTLGNIVASAGNIDATLGSMSAGTTITAGTGITSTTGNISASAGQVNAGTSMTAGTTITATLGNITATNGNFVASTAGTGLVLPVGTASGATPQVVDARVGSVTFTGISIAAAADLTLVLTNSTITGASTRVMLTMSGSTTGSAPSIKSITPSAGSLSIVVTNGTGATTTTADITFDFIVLN
jgi:hypothetical protein